MNDLFLLCDLVHHVDFAKVNLDILESIKGTLRKYQTGAKQFKQDSGIPIRKTSNPPSPNLIFHDSISHKKIPSSLGKKWGAIDLTTDYLPLNKVSNRNENIEYIVDGIQGNPRRYDNNPLYNIGRALRKKTMSQSDKLLTQQRQSLLPELFPILSGRQPTNEDVLKIREKLKKNYVQPKQQPKIKGSKPQETTIEEKQQKLKQKYGIT